MFEGGALCLGPTIRENILWSAYAWRQIVYNWRAKLIAPLCRPRPKLGYSTVIVFVHR
jgi:hypothetical protein